MKRFRSLVVTLVTLLLLAAPALSVTAGTAERPDPRAQVEEVKVIVDNDGQIWVRICFAEPWGAEPPLDLFSFFFQLFVSGPQFSLGAGWQVHAGEVTPFGTNDQGEFTPEMYILEDGCVLLNTGLTTETEVPGLQGGIDSGSWEDEDTTQAVFESHQVDVPPEEFVHGDPFELFGPPIYNLTTGEPIEPPPTTTTTTEAVSTPEETTTTVAAVTPGAETPSTTEAPATTTRPRTVPREGVEVGETCGACLAVLLVLLLVLLCVLRHYVKREEWWECWTAWFFVIWVWAPLVLLWVLLFGPAVWWWWIPLLFWFPVIFWAWWWWARRRSWWVSWMAWIPVGWMVVLALLLVFSSPAWWWLVFFWLPAVVFYLWYRGRRQPWWLPWMWWAFGAWVLWFFVWAIWLGPGWVWFFPVVFFPVLWWWVGRSVGWDWDEWESSYWGPKLCWLIPWAFFPFLAWFVAAGSLLWCGITLLVLFLVLLCVLRHYVKREEWWECWTAWFFVIWVWAPLVLLWVLLFGPAVWWWWIPLLFWFPVIFWAWWWWARRRSWWVSWMAWIPVGWMVVLALLLVFSSPAWWWLVFFWLPAVVFYLWYRGRRQPWWLPWMWWAFGAWVLWFFVWAIWLGPGWVWFFPVVFFPVLWWWVGRSVGWDWDEWESSYWGPKLCWLIPWAFFPFLAWFVPLCAIG
ncbi:MAG: hypothetical protein ACE5F5_01520 [Acidimicrobiia bacterium]